MKRNDVEKPQLSLGHIALTDCAPLAVAKKRGFFEGEGLEVTLSRETSWANIRDKVAIGILDGAQMLAPMPLAMTAGIGPVQKSMVTALTLDLNGNAITVSEGLFQSMRELDPENSLSRERNGLALRRVIEARRAAGEKPLTFATVFPTATHTYELRYWMAAAGIDADRDIRLVVVPPPQMPGRLESGAIDGCCVGEPWNSAAVAAGIGRTLISKYELWNNSPEKVLGVTAEWAEQYPQTHAALVRALLEACRWLDSPAHRREAAELLSQKRYVNVDAGVMRRALTGGFSYENGGPIEICDDFTVFHRYGANFPWRSHAVWFLIQMVRWGQLPEETDLQRLAKEVYRPDLYRQAAKPLGINAPLTDYKREGGHTEPYAVAGTQGEITLGPDRFFDGLRFDPMYPHDYLERLAPQAGTRGNVVAFKAAVSTD